MESTLTRLTIYSSCDGVLSRNSPKSTHDGDPGFGSPRCSPPLLFVSKKRVTEAKVVSTDSGPRRNCVHNFNHEHYRLRKGNERSEWTAAELNRPLRNANAVYDRYTSGPGKHLNYIKLLISGWRCCLLGQGNRRSNSCLG
jgi:hypothetical protein